MFPPFEKDEEERYYVALYHVSEPQGSRDYAGFLTNYPRNYQSFRYDSLQESYHFKLVYSSPISKSEPVTFSVDKAELESYHLLFWVQSGSLETSAPISTEQQADCIESQESLALLEKSSQEMIMANAASSLHFGKLPLVHATDVVQGSDTEDNSPEEVLCELSVDLFHVNQNNLVLKTTCDSKMPSGEFSFDVKWGEASKVDPHPVSQKPSFKFNRKPLPCKNKIKSSPLLANYDTQLPIRFSMSYLYSDLFEVSQRIHNQLCDKFECPVCQHTAVVLQGLLLHLSTSHPGLEVSYEILEDTIQINMSIIKFHDTTMNFAWKRPRVMQLADFLPPLKRHQTNKPWLDALEGKFHHAIVTGQKITRDEFAYDSENDDEDVVNPLYGINNRVRMMDWVAKYHSRGIQNRLHLDDPSKKIMILWSTFVHQHKVIADSQIPQLCAEFVWKFGREIMTIPDGETLLLEHLILLAQYRILRPQDVQACMRTLRESLIDLNE